MWKILELIAFLGLPFGEGFANIMIKIVNILGIVNFFGLPYCGKKLEKFGDKLVDFDERVDLKLSGERWNKIFMFIGKFFILGPLYVYWLIIKWSCKLTWRLIRKIFRKR